jgi:ADP-ribose pyrophosphatase
MGTATTISSRTIYQGRIFEVALDRVRLPHGVEHDMEIVRHPGSVVMLPVPEPGRLILVRQFRYAVGRELWELPAGSRKPGEDPRTSPHRSPPPRRTRTSTSRWGRSPSTSSGA